MTTTSVLLGQLAATGWFAEHGEVALTAGLTFCLEKDPSAAEAFTRLIRERTGQAEGELRLPDRWQAEAIDEDRTRVDVAGWLDTNTEPAPVVFVEAKVSAAFAPRQVSHYAESQQRRLRNAGLDSGALVVLAPESRVLVAREEVAADLGCLGVATKAQCWVVDGTPPVAVTVLTWDKAIQVMLDADGPAASDLEQLLGACRALAGADISALSEGDLAGEWRNRENDVRLIINRVTREATAALSLAALPWVPGPSGGLKAGFRYIGASGQPNLSIGMRLDEANPDSSRRRCGSVR
ncbi:MAG: hypothetical protein M3O70_13325, partial [Actinomycetota bacterium]|nr:hypothetical protein [Actinomycetota bacterium]